MMDPDIEWHVPPILPDPATYRGHEGVKQFFETWNETFDDFEVYIEELIDAGDQVVARSAASA